VQKVDGVYVHGATERLWKAWQASRAALVVELPKDAPLMMHVEIKELLDKAGITYK